MKNIPFGTQCLQQTDYRFIDNKNLYGCFVASLRRIAEEVAQRAMTPRQNRELIQRLIRERAINSKMFLQNSDSHEHTLNASLDILGMWPEHKATYVAMTPTGTDTTNKVFNMKLWRKFENGEPGFWHIDQYSVEGASSHFVNARQDFTVWWDPHPGLDLRFVTSRRIFHVTNT